MIPVRCLRLSTPMGLLPFPLMGNQLNGTTKSWIKPTGSAIWSMMLLKDSLTASLKSFFGASVMTFRAARIGLRTVRKESSSLDCELRSPAFKVRAMEPQLRVCLRFGILFCLRQCFGFRPMLGLSCFQLMGRLKFG